MRERPTNAVLAVLAICLLVDLFFAGAQSDFMVTMGVFGALVLRALSDDPQPKVLTFLGVALAGLALALNHHIVGWESGWWFAVSLLLALLYALWERIVKIPRLSGPGGSERFPNGAGMNATLPKFEVVLWGIGHTHAHVVRMWRMRPIAGARLTCVSDFPTATDPIHQDYVARALDAAKRAAEITQAATLDPRSDGAALVQNGAGGHS